MSTLAVGVDIGGTFTDVVVLDARNGRVASRKVLTTHQDPALGAAAGIEAILDGETLSPQDVTRVVHATTLFTNALIERKGARTGLVTTRGFRDLLELGRERKYELYDLSPALPAPLVPRDRRREVGERVGARGEVVLPLDEVELSEVVDALVQEGCESIAIVFLHAWRDPRHELQAERVVSDRYPGLALSLSSRIAPEIREFERLTTTVVNAYVQPLAARYLASLSERITANGVAAPLLLMLSSGGLTHREEAERTPVHLLESGPAAGAITAAWIGESAGARELLAFDMGGTTAKLALIEGGEPLVAWEFEAARERRFMRGSGLPLRISTIELIEIGAGGGSIARLDELGLLKVGPQSAGSEPGPACYARGGTAPTVTDADLHLGYVDPGQFAGGQMQLDRAAARDALTGLAEQAGLGVDELAWGIHDVVNESMASAARVHVAERGRDPRRFSLLATGGAGPVHAFAVARKLGVQRIICPLRAGVASALGLLLAPARSDRVATVAEPLGGVDWSMLDAVYERLAAAALEVIRDAGLDTGQAWIERLGDLRYRGQAFELVVKLPPGPWTRESERAIRRAFEEAYRKTFGRIPPGVEIELVNARVAVRAPTGLAVAAHTTEAPRSPCAAPATPARSRRAWFPEAGGFLETPVLSRSELRPGEAGSGPAIIEEPDSTFVIGLGAAWSVDAMGNIVVDLE